MNSLVRAPLIAAAVLLCLSTACSDEPLSEHGGDPPEMDNPQDGVDAGDGQDLGGDTDASPDPDPPGLPPYAPAPATLHRLTASQYRASVRDLLGVEVQSALEEDTPLHGYVSVAASDLTIPPLAAEQYETAAWEAVSLAIADGVDTGHWIDCDPARPLCLRAWLTRFGKKAWRRPIRASEVAQIEAVANAVAQRFADPWQGVATALALVLQSPHFLFRVEVGEPDPAATDLRRYTDHEMAARLAAFLLGSTPDEALLSAADRGELTADAGLQREAERLLDDPRAQDALGDFFGQYMVLDRLESVSKDAELFPQLDAALREAMRREVELLFQEVVFESDGDFGDILITDLTFLDEGLAQIYGVEHDGSELMRASLPPELDRGGLLGRAALLTLNAHATLNSPTLRGRFVRERLLCQDIPPPPEGVVAALSEVDEESEPMTLRQRLDIHREDPACAGCHSMMDPMGFTMEHFDPIGRWRELDNNLPIDATGEVDGVPVDGVAELGQALSASGDFTACVARQLYRHAVGHLETLGELRVLESLTERFQNDGRNFKRLALHIVMSPGFRQATAPLGASCEDRGQTRPCATPCGEGEEVCAEGRWQGCTAIAPHREVCNNLDDDCDGEVDEDLISSCNGTCGGGFALCEGGTWGACQAPDPPAELCNGLDEDCDDEIDEDLEVNTITLTFSELAAQHEGCEGSQQRRGQECNAAINRACAGMSCSATGFGPVGTSGERATVSCLSEALVDTRQTTYSVLTTLHGPCDGTNQRIGPDCNAAIHRHCASLSLRTGFGPLENSGDNAYIACVPSAQVIHTTYSVLSGFEGGCSQSQRIGARCDAAIHSFCVQEGFETGWGPVENSGDIAVVSCVNP